MPLSYRAVCAASLMLFAGPIAPAQDAPAVAAPWPVTERAFPEGWVFTPGFSADGETAWLVAWADALNIFEPQRLYQLEHEAQGWGAPERLLVAPDALKDWPTPGDAPGTLFLTIATQTDFGRGRIDDFDLWRVDLTRPGLPRERLDGPDLNRAKTPETATRGVAHNEFGAQLTEAGDLWFWSERAGAAGRRDIFIARANGEGGWGTPEEFVFNTPGRESHPWVSNDGRTVIFTSDRPGGYGRDDLWITRRGPDGRWGDPVNLGAGVNSAFNDEAARVRPGPETLFFASDRPIPGARRAQGFRVWTAPAGAWVDLGDAP